MISRNLRYQRTSFNRMPFFLLPLAFCLFLACPKEKVDDGHPFECPEGFHVCGEDSTDCCVDIAECPPGQLPCENDSTQCCDVECSPGFVVGGPDSTDCVPVSCLPGYYLCGEDSTECCPEITSHDFRWTVEVLGTWQGKLYDVAILNRNDAWVVGRIQTSVEHNQDSIFNAAHWNGIDWEYVQVPVAQITPNGIADYYPYELRSILAFSKDDIWFGYAGLQLIHWDGENYTHYYAPFLSIDAIATHMWGTDGNNIFLTGYDGKIVHWNGSNFQLMESHTEVDILDIWGISDGSVIWACGWDDFEPTVLLRWDNGVWEKVFENENVSLIYPDTISGVMHTLWSDDPDKLFIATGFGFFECPGNTHGEGLRTPKWWSSMRLRGRTQGDMVLVGNGGTVWHYNGESWYQYLELSNSTDLLKNVDIEDDLIIAVGERYINGVEWFPVVYVGRR
jgi:hypothetical protein